MATKKNFSSSPVFDATKITDEKQLKILKAIKNSHVDPPDYLMQDIIDFCVDNHGNIHEMVAVGNKLVLQFTTPDAVGNLTAFKSDVIVCQKSLQVFNKLLVEKKRVAYEKYKANGEGDRDKYESLKALIGEVQKVLQKLYDLHKQVSDASAAQKSEAAKSLTVTMEEICDLEWHGREDEEKEDEEDGE